MAYSGSFHPKNVNKYRGDISKIKYRSNWEKYVMGWLDKNPDVDKWASEETVIPYFSNMDGKKRRYFMDFWVRYTNGEEFLIEVKPKYQTVEPTKPVKMTVGAKRKFMNELYTWHVNRDKWLAAQKYCERNRMTFRILTEDGLAQIGYHVGGK